MDAPTYSVLFSVWWFTFCFFIGFGFQFGFEKARRQPGCPYLVPLTREVQDIHGEKNRFRV